MVVRGCASGTVFDSFAVVSRGRRSMRGEAMKKENKTGRTLMAEIGRTV